MNGDRFDDGVEFQITRRYTRPMTVQILTALIVTATLSAGAAFAQGRMVDPSKVKPEFRAAAEKRAAEQKKLADCQKQAAAQKLLPRDRVKFLTNCLDK